MKALVTDFQEVYAMITSHQLCSKLMCTVTALWSWNILNFLLSYCSELIIPCWSCVEVRETLLVMCFLHKDFKNHFWFFFCTFNSLQHFLYIWIFNHFLNDKLQKGTRLSLAVHFPFSDLIPIKGDCYDFT